jgi:hypothetical protein
MAVSVFKVLSCSTLLAAIIGFVFDLWIAHGLRIHEVIYWAVVGVSLALGGYLARFISWGWLAGGALGLSAGFYLPLTLTFVVTGTGYETVLPWLLLSAGVGVFLGGYNLDKFFKSRLRH